MFSAPLHIGIYHFTEDKQEFSSLTLKLLVLFFYARDGFR
jgi:hypothetical protein